MLTSACFLLEFADISLLWRHCEFVEHRIFSEKGVLLDMILGANNEGQAQMLSQHGTVLQGLVYCCELVKMIHKNCG